jgi:hypothetical protein
MKFKEFYDKKLIQEVHYTDVYPKTFQEFYNKWKKFKNNPDLFVRFDNGNTTDVLSKDASKNPNHSDPIGTYAYPLKYVIDYPGDIWYGHNSMFLKVIKDKTKKGYVRLDAISYSDARNYLRKVGLDGSYDLAEKFYPDRAKGVTAPSKLFMSALQMNFSGATLPKDRKKVPNPVSPSTKSSEEQTALLLKMGIRTLEDRANRLSQASINEREPEQIVWLRPIDFEILETYRLSDRIPNRSSVTFPTEKISKKIAAEIAEIMSDRIVDSSSDKEFWTRNERKIIIEPYDVSLKYRMDNMKMGQKPHKFFKKNNQYAFKITVHSERGSFNEFIGADEKIQTGLNDFMVSWNNRESTDNGKRYSKKQEEEDKKREKDERIRQENEKKLKEYVHNFDYYFADKFNKIADALGFNKIPNNLSPEEKAKTYHAMQLQLFGMSEEIRNRFYKNINEEILENYEKILNYIGGNNHSRFPGHNLDAALEKIAEKNPLN